MDTRLQSGGPSLLSQLLDDSDHLAEHLPTISKWIENWKIPKGRGEHLVNTMHKKISEIDVLAKAQALAPQMEDLNAEIVGRKAEWDKCNVELLKGIAFKKITEIEGLQKETRALTIEVEEKETEIGILRKKAQDNINSRVLVLMETMAKNAKDDKLRIESLESELIEKSETAEILEVRVRALTQRLWEKELFIDLRQKKFDAEALQSGSQEAARLECDIIFETFRAAFLHTEWEHTQLDKGSAETPLKSLLEVECTKGGQEEEISVKLMSDETGPGQRGDALPMEMDVEHRQVETKRFRDGEKNEERNVSVKRRVSILNVPGTEESSKEKENVEFEEEIEMLTPEQYQDAMLESTKMKKRSQHDVHDSTSNYSMQIARRRKTGL